ncbi:1-phosphofructokinase family hexose kinase [Salinarimonas soli]|uniref:Phosphofructokinase n=1 Tax=Salinarimonas soli TaxID=1638099 RepID=A0A5B2VGH7_9HYPH|nr:1-phosphofructokinase family hexose kinase [Salinarimonas soli]KAA2238211.1 1-phosphofructokinase family hexose kinase [Salinarimonas soli]
MTRIATLTLNPSIDGASEADAVRPIHKVRTTNERYDPGGGGINVARVIHALGGEATALYLAGGATGAVLDELLEGRGIARRRIEIADQTRVSHAVFERSTGFEYRFTPEGPEIRESEWRACLTAIEATPCDYLVASGSLPRGVPAGFYVEVGRIAARRGTRFVVDTSGEALRAVLAEGGLHLVKPSLGDLESAVGRRLREPGEEDAAALSLVESRAAEIVAVTMGHEGALLATQAGALYLPAPDVPVQSAVGAGDSFLAALVLRLSQGRPLEEAFRWAVAAGTAAVLTPGTELCHRADVERIYGAVAAPVARPVQRSA